MHPPESLRRAFVGFHLSLGLMLLVGSILTVLGEGQRDPHVAILGSVEAIAAVLFLLPRTLRLGAPLLLATFAIAFLIHLARGQFPDTLIVFAAGVIFVRVHGSAYTRGPRQPSAA